MSSIWEVTLTRWHYPLSPVIHVSAELPQSEMHISFITLKSAAKTKSHYVLSRVLCFRAHSREEKSFSAMAQHGADHAHSEGVRAFFHKGFPIQKTISDTPIL